MDRIEKIISVLDENKAEDIEHVDMRTKEYFVNDVIIATSLNNRHSLALLDYLKKELKKEPYKEEFLHIEESGEWIVIDLGDFLIHIMVLEYRQKYNLEKFLGEFTELKTQ